MAETFHLGLNASDIDGASLAIVPGDPNRVERIAQLLDEPRALADHREFTSWIGKLDGNSVVVCSTGIGGPSTSIAVEELAQLGVTT
ncbi:MAG: uridine phosphorylase, partial [Ilumatobacter sp.]